MSKAKKDELKLPANRYEKKWLRLCRDVTGGDFAQQIVSGTLEGELVMPHLQHWIDDHQKTGIPLPTESLKWRVIKYDADDLREIPSDDWIYGTMRDAVICDIAAEMIRDAGGDPVPHMGITAIVFRMYEIYEIITDRMVPHMVTSSKHNPKPPMRINAASLHAAE